MVCPEDYLPWPEEFENGLAAFPPGRVKEHTGLYVPIV